jgi:hypothetical protein
MFGTCFHILCHILPFLVIYSPFLGTFACTFHTFLGHKHPSPSNDTTHITHSLRILEPCALFLFQSNALHMLYIFFAAPHPLLKHVQ